MREASEKATLAIAIALGDEPCPETVSIRKNRKWTHYTFEDEEDLSSSASQSETLTTASTESTLPLLSCTEEERALIGSMVTKLSTAKYSDLSPWGELAREIGKIGKKIDKLHPFTLLIVVLSPELIVPFKKIFEHRVLGTGWMQGTNSDGFWYRLEKAKKGEMLTEPHIKELADSFEGVKISDIKELIAKSDWNGMHRYLIKKIAS